MDSTIDMEQKIIELLMSKTPSCDEIGMLHGKTGVAFYFYHLAQRRKNNYYQEIANDIIINVAKAIDKNTSIKFATGITGIGWTIESLIKNNLIDFDADKMLARFDRIVKNSLLYDDNDYESIISIGFYYASRLCYRINDDKSKRVLDLKLCTIMLIDELDKLIMLNGGSPEAAHLLDELLTLNLFNYKVRKLQNRIGNYPNDHLIPFVPKLELDKYNLDNDTSLGLKNGLAGFGLQLLINEQI